MKMPNQYTLDILLHISFKNEYLRVCRASEDALEFLERNLMIREEKEQQSSFHGWRLTEKGRVWLNFIMNVPFPLESTSYLIQLEASKSED